MLALSAPAGAVLSGENGRIIFASGRNEASDATAKLYLLPVPSSTGGGSVTGPIITTPSVQHRHPTWSPDRTMVAYAAGDALCTPTKCDIYVLDLTLPGATPVNITNSPTVNEDRPAWSPDGTRLAYESEVSSGSNQLDIIVDDAPFGTGTLNLTNSGTVIDSKPAWSPDSQTLYYSVGNVFVAPNGSNNDVKIFQEPANNTGTATAVVHISGGHSFQPAISPDGTKMCFTLGTSAGLNSGANIMVKSLNPAGTPSVLASSGAGDYNCTWSPDGVFVAYVTGTFSSGKLVMERADNTSPFPIELAQDAGGNRFDGNPDWAPDARPLCPDSQFTTTSGQAVTFQVVCTDTGPAYEQTDVKEFAETAPANGTLAQNFAGDPFTYTPNAGFTGTDAFQVRSFDELGFGSDTGTVRIVVEPPLRCAGRTATRVGTAGNDIINGTRGRDVIVAIGGNDRIRGGRGNDVICGGLGRDNIGGGAGRDRARGGAGNDRIAGQAGNDNLRGDAGRDRVSGGSGRDLVLGGAGIDRLLGGTGMDRLRGGAGRDTCSEGAVASVTFSC
jgi:Tol biopolymer transport system component